MANYLEVPWGIGVGKSERKLYELDMYEVCAFDFLDSSLGPNKPKLLGFFTPTSYQETEFS